MPSSRRLKVTGLAAFITVCVLFYITNGQSSTQNSAFYIRTKDAIQNKQLAQSREALLLKEVNENLQRMDKIEKEHFKALSAVPPKETDMPTQDSSGSGFQRPIIPNGNYGASKVADIKQGERAVAGRKYMKDGRVVTYKPKGSDDDDGVAKVGNVEPHSSHTPVDANDDEEAVEAALNDILRKGPIIIFSKTYCPHSKRAKHILLEQYSIIPPPYVVELDEHKLGAGLQRALESFTSRRTVPNVLINGKSIGGGDDVQELHDTDKLASTIQSMGGKRMTKVLRLEEAKREMKFKA